MVTLEIKSIPELEREMLYCQSKADFIHDLISQGFPGCGFTVCVGMANTVFTTFQLSDLYSESVSLDMLGTLEQLFRLKAEGLSWAIKKQRGQIQKLITDGYEQRESISPGSQ